MHNTRSWRHAGDLRPLSLPLSSPPPRRNIRFGVSQRGVGVLGARLGWASSEENRPRRSCFSRGHAPVVDRHRGAERRKPRSRTLTGRPNARFDEARAAQPNRATRAHNPPPWTFHGDPMPHRRKSHFEQTPATPPCRANKLPASSAAPAGQDTVKPQPAPCSDVELLEERRRQLLVSDV